MMGGIMKGRISARLERILQDPRARTQLRRSLINGKTGRVTVGEKTYRVSRVGTILNLQTPLSRKRQVEEE
jgi:hypothetical protein